MKYLKIYENFQIEEGFILRDRSIDIDGICQKYGIENFTIKNGLVDVYRSIDFAGIIGDFIPLKFGHVNGDFYCDNNQLTSLEGAPKSIGGSFYCDGNPVYEVWNLISPDDKWDDVKMELFSDYDCLRGTDIIIDRFNQFLLQIGKEPVTFVKGYNSI